MNTDTIGNRIRTIRKGQRLTQKQFAKRLGVSSSSVSSYEIGDSLPSIEVLIKLADIGEVSYDWLLAGCYMARDPQNKIIQLTKEELELLKLYRDATPKDREVIKRVAELTTKPNPSDQ